MTNNKKNIETLFKDGLNDYSVNPRQSLWNKINRKLTFNNFLKFNFAKFNIYYTFLIVSVTTIAIYNISNNNTFKVVKRNNSQIIEKLIISENTNNKETNKIIENIVEASSPDNLIQKEAIILNNDKLKKEKKHINSNVIIENVVTKDITEDIANLDENINLKLANPSANFSASTYNACVPATVFFSNESENCETYLWNFGNEVTSSDANPTFVFKTAGKYTVTLTVYSSGISSSISRLIIVNPKPKSEFIISNKNNIFRGDEVRFANLSQDFRSCVWNFGDGNVSSFTHPAHTFDEAGLYNISLICFSDNNCSDTVTVKNFQIKKDKYKIFVPTAISPNLNGADQGRVQRGNYSKSIFIPIFNSEPKDYYLRIFNKFGSIVFESKDVNFGWNGYYNNKPAPLDVYIWECSGKFSDGQMFIKTGNLTLLYLNNQ